MLYPSRKYQRTDSDAFYRLHTKLHHFWARHSTPGATRFVEPHLDQKIVVTGRVLPITDQFRDEFLVHFRKAPPLSQYSLRESQAKYLRAKLSSHSHKGNDLCIRSLERNSCLRRSLQVEHIPIELMNGLSR